MPAIARWSRGGGRPFPPLSEAGPTADPGVVACGWLLVGGGGGELLCVSLPMSYTTTTP